MWPKNVIIQWLYNFISTQGAIEHESGEYRPFNNEDVKLTELGKEMAGFPLDPKFTKAILAAKELGCT